MQLNGTTIICQVSTPELLIKMRNVSKNSLIEAMEARRDGVFFRVVLFLILIILEVMIQVCCTTGFAIRRTQVDEIAFFQG
jgi:hypothetical protein